MNLHLDLKHFLHDSDLELGGTLMVLLSSVALTASILGLGG